MGYGSHLFVFLADSALEGLTWAIRPSSMPARIFEKSMPEIGGVPLNLTSAQLEGMNP